MKKSRAIKSKQTKPKRQRKRAPQQSETADSMASAAAKLGVNVRVLQAAKAAGCAGFVNGRVRLADVRTWLVDPKNAAAIEAAAGSDFDRVKLAILRQKLRIFRHDADLLDQMVIPVDDVRRSFVRMALALKSKLLATEKTIGMEAAMRLALDEPKVQSLQEIVGKHLRGALAEMAGHKWGTVECPNCKKEIRGE